MKKIYIGLLFSLFSLLACQDDDIDSQGEGRLALNVAFNTKTNPIIAVRSGERDYTVTISDAKGNPLYTFTNDDLPEEIALSPGSYTAEATSGTNPDAAFASPYFTGSKGFSIKANETAETTVECLLANAKVSVDYSDRIKQYFSAYRTTIGVPRGSITYTEENTQDGYFKVTRDSILLTWELNVCNTAGEVFTRSGNFYAKKRWHYALNFDISEKEETEEGGLKVDIIVNDDVKQVDKHFDIMLRALPEIAGDDFDITAPVAVQFKEDKQQYNEHYKINLKGNPKLDSISFSHNCNYLNLNGIPYHFSLINLSDNARSTLEKNGLTWVFSADSTTASMDFTGLLPKLGIGSYNFTFEAVNTEGKKNAATFQLAVVDADVLTLSTPAGTSDDVWAHHARLAGTWITDGQPSGLKIQYREQGTLDWITRDAEVRDKKFYITIDNLKSETTYEYQASSLKDGVDACANILTFTTESAAPLPNSSFDEWDGTYPWAAGSSERDKFWDTGNKAAEIAKLVLTQSSDDTPAEVAGGKSAYLKSQYTKAFGIADVFAAGNIFSGVFGKIEGTSGASMTFGQPYTSRPQKLKGYYKYKSKTIDWDKKGGLKGYEDRFHIYIILADEAHYLNTTDQSTLFDMDNIKAGKDPHTIAFAELSNEKFDASGKDITPAVNMNNYEAFELELNYFKTDVKPSYIIVAATSSKYGDYYTGGIGSELYIDAFELVFE